jgi:hypothetical protein
LRTREWGEHALAARPAGHRGGDGVSNGSGPVTAEHRILPYPPVGIASLGTTDHLLSLPDPATAAADHAATALGVHRVDARER